MQIRATEAETALSNLFETRRAQFTERPLDAARTQAFARFAAAGLPHRRIEAYRYTDLRAKLRQLPPAAGAPDMAAVDRALAATPPHGSHRVVIANGRFVPERSSVPAGVTVADILDPAADASGIGDLVRDSDDPLTLANVSLFDGGVVLRVSGTVAEPVEIVTLAPSGALSMRRLAVFVAPGAMVTLVDQTVSGPGAVANDLAELTLGEGARADIVRLAHGPADDAVHLSTLHARLAEGARLEHLTVSTGRGLSRNQAFAHVAGDDAEANFRAATVAVRGRHVDNTLVVRHDALGSRSSQILKSAVASAGTAIVQGRIIVDPGAQKTDARMMSNALFLDEAGEVVNKPELEIFADDVQCGHGATSGDLDAEPVFYLRARGIPEGQARRLLVEAFLADALDRVEIEPIRDALAAELRAALDDALDTDSTGAA
jgi:Fe-S cluster assembly protein SufD